MRILIIGASGPIGRAVVQQLTAHHQIVKAGRSHGDFQVDIRGQESVSQLFREVGLLDAIVCAAGHVHFDPLACLIHRTWFDLADERLRGYKGAGAGRVSVRG